MVKWIYRFENFISGILLLAVTGVLVGNVVLRYLFNSSTSWSEEFIRYGFIWITFIGSAICVRTLAHVNIDIIPNFLNGTAKRTLSIITSIIALVFLIWLGILGLDLALFNYQTGQTSPSLGLPIFYIYLAIPLGCLLMIIHYIELIIKYIKNEKVESEKTVA